MNPTINRSAPGVRIVLLPESRATSGEPVDLSGRIISFSFEDSERKADKLTLQLDNHDLSLFERDDLVGGAILQVSWGYPELMSPPRRVVLKKLKGFTTLTLEGRALSVLMDQVEKTRMFSGVTRSDVVSRIASEHGYERGFVDIDETFEVFDVINQSGHSDARFIRQLAEREGFEFYVDGSGLHFHRRRQSAPPTHVFEWFSDPGRGDILAINVESDLGRRVGKVTVKARDPLEKRTIVKSVSNASARRETLADVVEVVSPDSVETSLQMRNATETVHASTATSERQAEVEAQARYRKAEQMSVNLSMQLIGDPTLHAKSIVEIRGISSLLSGKYYVTDVKHTVSGSGYFCDVKLIRDGSGRRARRRAQEMKGEKNRAVAKPRTEELEEVELIGHEHGEIRIGYKKRT